MKPRIFINIHYLEIGGAETSLIGMLQALDPARVDVDLFLNDHRGEMMRYVPSWVRILPPSKAYSMIERPIREVVGAGCIGIAAARLWAKLLFRRCLRRDPQARDAIYGYVSKCVMPFLPSLKRLGEYDLAIAFLPPYGVVADKVRARKKVCWMHSDYTRIGVDREVELAVWSRYDTVVAVSDDAARTYCSAFPEMRPRTAVIENILSPELVRRRAAAQPRPVDMPKEDGCLTLLTVGRYSPQKRQDEIPLICRLLTQRGVAVKWYLIGYGGSGDYIRKAIADEGMEGRVIILGKRENPYPYIAACDWYVQPSRYEGKSVAVREAQMLGKAVIITDYPTSPSQVRNGEDGVIVPMPAVECAEAMAEVLRDERLKRSLEACTSSRDYGNESEAEKIYALIPPPSL